MIYELRPNVTVDAAGLAIKSSNAIILRGSEDALNSNIYLNNLLNRVLDAYKKVGITAKPIKIGGGCDGNIYLKNGFHSVILGVGMYKIHTIEEYLVISDMEKTAEAVMEFITK